MVSHRSADPATSPWRGPQKRQKFKGVVPQQNGHWGAQIYANQKRIWLGTFKSESDAAAAYDSAAIRIRSGDPHRNFPWTPATLSEPHFQRQLTTQDLLSMIKDGSYPQKFREFLGGSHVPGTCARGNLALKQLFEKELTPSDVGKLNRLVIPKKYAVKHFPEINDREREENDIELVFRDKAMRGWKFRYCYWKSSQSFVFTRGWNRFVKDKGLRENDTVVFYSCESGDFVIDVVKERNDSEIGEGQNGNFGFKLFGVQIFASSSQ